MRIGKREIALALCAVFLTALVCSRFLLSVSMFGLAMVGLLEVQKTAGRWKIQVNPILIQHLKRFGLPLEYAVLLLLFFVVLCSGWQTEDWQFWLQRLRIKLPFLILPIAFLGLPVFSQRQYLALGYYLLLLLFVTCIGIGTNYLFHFEAITESIKHGKSIPTPANHIRFSLLLALGILGGTWLAWKQFYWKFYWEKRLIQGITVFLFGFIFLLAVRSGLVALYAGLLVLLIHYVNTTKNYWKTAVLVGFLLAMPIVAYLTFPSFTAKIGYVQEDLMMHERGKGENYSDSGRLTSIQMGMELAKAHPLLGVGAGNLQQEVENLYAKAYPHLQDAKLPHNQFVWILAANGLVGLLLFSLAFFYPMFHNGNYRQPLFLAFHVVMFTSFLTESTLETALGVALYVFFLLLGLNYQVQYCPQTNLRSVYEPLPRTPNLVR